MNKELIGALDALEKEKGISKDILIEAIENSLITGCSQPFVFLVYNYYTIIALMIFSAYIQTVISRTIIDKYYFNINICLSHDTLYTFVKV